MTSTAPTSSSAATATDFSSSSLFNVDGLSACITGAGTGLGLYAAQALASNGCKVYILGRRLEVLQGAADRFNNASKNKNGKLIPIQADVTSKDSLAKAAREIASQQGNAGIDILICNTGIGGRMLKNYGKSGFDTSNFDNLQQELNSFTEEEAAQIFQVNTLGLYFTSTTFLPLLKTASEHHKSSGGQSGYIPQVIVISSNAAWAKLPILNALYNLSKTAASHWGQMLSTMLTDSGIRCNTIEPGLFPSELTSPGTVDASSGHSSLSGTNGADIPIGRAGLPHEYASIVLYLCSRSSLFANGATMRIDGAALQKLPASD